MPFFSKSNSDSDHPLEFGIEEIDLSQNKYSTQQRNNSISNYTNQITEINLLKTNNLPKETDNIDNKPQILPKPKAPKRIAPRMLPKIPDKIPEKATVNNAFSKQESKIEPTLNNENFFIGIDQVGWYYKKESNVESNNAKDSNNNSVQLKTQYSVPVSPNLMDDLSYVEDNKDKLQNGGTDKDNNSTTTTNNKKWIPFSKLDTINLETKHRFLHNNSKSENVHVSVLGDIYEVNLSTKKCYSIYWKAKRTFSVMRSVWFQDNNYLEPFEEKSSEEIEQKHYELFSDVLSRSSDSDFSLNTSQSDSITEHGSRAEAASPTEEMKSKTLAEPVGSVNIEEGVVSWYSIDEVYWEKNKMSLIEKMNFGLSKFRNKINGMRIRRGYKHPKTKENESDYDKDQEITHLVFVVHGIAQKMYENGIVKNCDDLRKECDKKKKEYFPNNKNQRYMFLPVDWRSSLTLDDGIVETVTPNSIQAIREKLNSSALDIMYYTSPLFRIEILNSLSSELNRLYNLFCEKNPYFKEKYRKVSFVAHSLGTVIVYDILTSDHSLTQFYQNSYSQVSKHEREKFQNYAKNDSNLLNEYLNCKNRIQEIENEIVQYNNNVLPLGFQTENFFSLGSPLAVFLAMRGVRPAGTGTQEHILPKNLCKHLYNIFHPSDPIAYRLEPLIIKNYSNKNPIEIQKSDAAPKLSYKELNEKRSAVYDRSLSLTSSTRHSKSRNKSMEKELEESVAYNPTGVSIQGYTPSPAIEQVELENALDFQLQDSNFELMATLRAHTCYWKSPDIGMFISSQLCMNDIDTDEPLYSEKLGWKKISSL